MEIRKLPAVKERVETGVVEFEGDWPAVFIRGKHAFLYACALERLLEKTSKEPPSSGQSEKSESREEFMEMYQMTVLRDLLTLLKNSDVTAPTAKAVGFFKSGPGPKARVA